MVEFSNQWYRDTCAKEGYNPDNVLSEVLIELARECAMGMKKFMDAKKNYPDEKIQQKLELGINELNNKRIGYMLDALQFAELVVNNGKGFNEFLKKQTGGRAVASNGEDLTAVEQRVSDRWNEAMSRQREG